MRADAIIVALDVPSAAAAIALVDRLPEVQWFKVGLELYTAVGASIVTALKERGKKVFLDLKLHDIPQTVANTVTIVAAMGVDLLTVHACGGLAMLQAAQAQAQDCQIIAVTLLTSLEANALASELQVSLSLADYVPSMAALAQRAGLAGVVCSAQEASAIRQRCGDDFLLVTPGIRPQGSAVGDQQRVTTPQAAFAAGANLLVIGRPITQAADPSAAWTAIAQAL